MVRSLSAAAVSGFLLGFVMVCCSLFTPAKAQNGDQQEDRYTLSGYVKQSSSGEALAGATIYVLDSEKGANTNSYGFYSLTLAGGEYQIIASYLGYGRDTIRVNLDQDIKKNIELTKKSIKTQDVVIQGEAADKNVTSTEMSSMELSAEELREVPQLFGETDVLRTIQFMPGVKSGGEGTSSFFVRGGDYDQNLILLDEATVYNPSHLLGFFSVFNPDALQGLKLYKGGIPSRYGGRLSSVLDIKMKEGNMRNYNVRGGIGLLSTRLTAEGPIAKDKASFLVTGRRTYADLFLNLSNDPDLRNNTLYFYDFNAKLNWQPSEKDRVFASGYFGQDVFQFGDQFGTNWGNSTATVRWNHLFSDKFFLNTTAIFSDFTYEFNLSQQQENVDYISGIRDYSLNLDFEYFLNPENHIRFGAEAIHHTFRPGKFEPQGESNLASSFSLENKYALEAALYASNEQELGRRWTINYGLRMPYFAQFGPGRTLGGKPDSVYNRLEQAGVISSSAPRDTVLDLPANELPDSLSGAFTEHNSFDRIKDYLRLAPRLSVRYLLTDNSSLKASYNRTYQFLHIASNSTASLPLDLWVPSTRTVPEQRADQIALGYFRNFKQNTYETSVEVYYKWLDNQIDFRNGAQIIGNRFQQYEFLFGNGWAYGMELLARKNKGRFTGWASYSLSWSWRRFEELNDGEKFWASNDRRHAFSIVMKYQILDRLSASATWTYTTGQPVSLPSNKYQLDGQVVGVFSQRNGQRFPDYHRADASVTYDFPSKKRFQSSLNLSVYNLYARKNPWSLELRPSEDRQTQQAYKIYLFTIVPALTYNFEF